MDDDQNSSISISNKKLASYCLDYALLTTSSATLGKKIETPDIASSFLSVDDIFFGDEEPSLTFRLNVRKESMPDNLNDNDKQAIEDRNRQIDKEIKISNKVDDILLKLKTQGYTKQVVLQTGFVSYDARHVSNSYFDDQQKAGDIEEVKEAPLLQVRINIRCTHQSDCNEIHIDVVDSSVKIIIEQFNKFLPSNEYDEIFGYVTKLETDQKLSFPLNREVIDDLWSQIAFYLNKHEAEHVSEHVDITKSKIVLTNRVNYFLTEDLKRIAEDDDDELDESSLGAWSSDDEMNISEEVFDDGQTEIFFPFSYDKWQLSVLGIMKNKAAIVEGPPGTGKSQTIANLITHLAATGKRVLFASQKDQAVRGVKDKLKSLGIKFMFGYIPDRSSRLNTEEDEIDGASNALLAINQEFHKESMQHDHKIPLQKIHDCKIAFIDDMKAQRRAYGIVERLEQLEYVRQYAKSNVSKDDIDKYKSCMEGVALSQSSLNDLESQIEQISFMKKYADLNFQNHFDDIKSYMNVVGEIESKNAQLQSVVGRLGDYAKKKDEDYRNIEFCDKERFILDRINELRECLMNLLPDGRSGKLKDLGLRLRVKGVCNSTIRNVYQEISNDAEQIALSKELTKSKKMYELGRLRDYFATLVDRKDLSKLNDSANSILAKISDKNDVATVKQCVKEFVQITDGSSLLNRYVELSADYSRASDVVGSNRSQMDNIAERTGLLGAQLERLAKMELSDLNSVYEDILEHRRLSEELDGLEKKYAPSSLNEIRSNIMELRRYYVKDIGKYVQNRILDNIEKLKSSKNTKARIERIARSLTKSKKAYKTFDKLKNDPDNFEVMANVLPVWMMSLEDVSRIIPARVNCFDYVIIDEASQCNIAFALPVMMRAKHTIFFGDSLQMRDTNTLFKSNEQLQSIAKKHDVPDEYQIKASEDTVKSVMDIATLAGFKTITLRNHYRSPRQLIGFSNENFYKKVGKGLEVINDNIVRYRDTDRVMVNHVIEVDDSLEDSPKTNHSEAIYVKEMIKQIKTDPVMSNKTIAVLTFFNEQAELLQKELEQFDDVKVSTIEGIQGDERDVVIYSFVITDPNAGKKRYAPLTGEGGEIRRSANEGRVNVAFSRAKEQVHCVTSIPIDLWPDKVWIKRYLQYVEDNGSVAYRHNFDEQRFDSNFEKDVYRYLSDKLSPSNYTLQTQVESCGFRIDLVVTCLANNKKLAIECDGPTHFENGDGQVYVTDDYERQSVLESAGWVFYRLSYFDYIEDKNLALDDLCKYIVSYCAGSTNISKQNKSSKIVEELKKLEVAPSKAKLPVYRTNFGDGISSNNLVKESSSKESTLFSTHSIGESSRSNKTASSSVSTNGKTSLPPRQIDQAVFQNYLITHLNKDIVIKYWPLKRQSPDTRYRELRLVGFDDKYLYCNNGSTPYNGRYLRVRVVDYR